MTTKLVTNFDVLNLLFGYITRVPIKDSDNENFLIYELANNGPQFFGQFKYSPKQPEHINVNLASQLSEIPIPENMDLIKYSLVSFPFKFFQSQDEDISQLVGDGWIEPTMEDSDIVYAITYTIHINEKHSKLVIPSLGVAKEQVWAIPPAWYYTHTSVFAVDFYPIPEPKGKILIA